MDERLEEELTLLRGRWPDLDYDEDGRWVLLPDYSMPGPIEQDEAVVCFQVHRRHPQQAPYAFWVRKPIELTSGQPFDNVKDGSDPPFEGDWLQFSWRLENWKPGPTPKEGTNLVNWAHSFHNRLKDGK